jgi:hypothetical protein
MFRAVLKLTYFPGARGLVLPQYSELQASLQINDEPVMILTPASVSVGY